LGTEKVGYELTLRDLMSRGLGDINSKLNQLEGNLKKAESAGSRMGANMSKAFGAIGTALSIGAIYESGKAITQTTAKFQSLSNSIKFASDTATQGESSMIWISDLSKKYGLPIQETAEGFKTLQGAMMKTKFSSTEVRRMFSQVSTGVIAMGLSADDAKGTFLALGQIMGKGKVQAEELRGQIGERIPGAFSIAARAMGKTTAELDKMMKDGKLLSEDFLPKFAAEMEKTFGKGAENSVDSLSASLARLSNSWVEMQTSLGNTIGMKLVYKSMDGYTKLFNVIAETFKSQEQKIREKNNPGVMDYLANLEDRTRATKESFEKKGMSKKDIDLRLTSERDKEINNLDRLIGIAQKNLDVAAKPMLTENLSTKEKFFGVSKEKKQDYQNQKEIIELLKTEKTGASQYFDKAISDVYNQKPNGGMDDELKKESNSISGHTPKTVHINVEALIKGDVKNYIGDAKNPQSDVANFMSKLEQALLTVVNDVNIITE
jgi:tape measure domain-containing protein